MGGIKVPKAAQKPIAIAYPSDNPRYRILNPKVRPPTPQRVPKMYAHHILLTGLAKRIAHRSDVVSHAIAIGITTQAAKPWVNQYVSQAQPLTFLKGM
jgi:hypothetical protein